jgi:magnesium transporter
MNKYAGQRSKKSGLAPGTLVHIGERKIESIVVTVIEFDETRFTEKTLDNLSDFVFDNSDGMVRWINIDGLHDTKLLEYIGSNFGLHPLVMEDMLNTEQRPKIEDYGEYIYIVLKILKCGQEGQDLYTDQQNLVLGKNFVLSIGETVNELFDSVRKRLRNGGRIRCTGADYLTYALMDSIVDNYFDVLERFGERIENTEERMIRKPDDKTLLAINDLKRDMLYIHRSIWPLREVAGLLERGETHLMQESTRLYTRDLYDHTIQAMDTTEIYRDILSGMLDIYLSSISNRMNEVMKVLTIISTLFIPLTFIVGVYGMNFKYIPELEWHWSYYAVLLVMAVLVTGMLVLFRRRKWL